MIPCETLDTQKLLLSFPPSQPVIFSNNFYHFFWKQIGNLLEKFVFSRVNPTNFAYFLEKIKIRRVNPTNFACFLEKIAKVSIKENWKKSLAPSFFMYFQMEKKKKKHWDLDWDCVKSTFI